MTSVEDDYDMIFKVVLIGDSFVGKTNILTRYLKNEFRFDTKATVGVEFGSRKYEMDGYVIKAQIWDTAGQERYKAITNAYYKGAKGALLVYDITRKETFDNVERWIPDLKMNGDEQVTIILIGNKCDLENQRQVTKEEGENKAKLFNIAFLETSANTTVNIHEAFDLMIKEIFRKFHQQVEEQVEEDVTIDNKAIDLRAKPIESKENNKKCC